MKTRPLTLAAGLLGAAALAETYRAFVRPWVMTWGATVDEATATLPGDELLPDADDGVLVLGEYPVDAVHVQAEQVLDPVVGGRAASRGRSHLDEPRVDGLRRRVDGAGQRLQEGAGPAVDVVLVAQPRRRRAAALGASGRARSGGRPRRR